MARSDDCAVLSRLSWKARSTQVPRSQRGTTTSTSARAATASSERIAVKRPRLPRKSAIASTGSTSPTAPVASTDWPNGEPVSPRSRSRGSRIPSAVVVRQSATAT